jgi:hypothetical protein
MKRQMIIHVHPDDRVEVKVEGLTEVDNPKPAGKKLCDKITHGLEQDLGLVIHRRYEEAHDAQSVEIDLDQRQSH